MRTLYVIGIGVGDPDHLTLAAVDAIGRADVFFIVDKGGAVDALGAMRRTICDRFGRPGHRVVPIPEVGRDREPERYRVEVDTWHRRRTDRYRRAVADGLADDGVGAFLVWGDPSLYDSTLRILEAMRGDDGVPAHVEVVPGVTSVAALAAAHRRPLHDIGEAVTITTGRRLREDGWPAGARHVVVMLDGEAAFRHLVGAGLAIWWGAYLGTPDEILISGPLDDVADRIVASRAEARAAHGWIMDTYLLEPT